MQQQQRRNTLGTVPANTSGGTSRHADAGTSDPQQVVGGSLSAKLAAKRGYVDAIKNRHDHAEGALTSSSFSNVMTDDEIRTVVEHMTTKVLLLEDASWERRAECLQRLAQLVATSGVLSRPCAAALFGSYNMKRAIALQLLELRSAVVRACLSCLRNMAASLPTNKPEVWSAVFEPHVGAILQCRGSSVAVVAQAAEAVLACAAERGGVACCRGMLQQLLQTATTSKHPPIRITAVRLVTLMLVASERSSTAQDANNNSNINPAGPRGWVRRLPMDQLVQMIRSTLNDSAEECRRFARRCFWALEQSSPDDALLLFETLGESLRHKLDDDKSSYLRWLAEEVPANLPNPINPPVTQPTVESSAHSGKEERQLHVAPSHGTTVARARSPVASARAPQPLTPRGTTASAAPHVPQYVAPSATIPTPAASAGSPRAGHQPSAAAAAADTAASQGTVYGGGGGYAPRHASSSARLATPTRHSATKQNRQLGASPLEAAFREKDAAVLQELWRQIMVSAQSSDWSTRVQALRQLTRYITSVQSGGLELSKSQQVPDMMRMLPFRLGDPHFRVAAEAIECFDALLRMVPAHILDELPQLLPVFFQHTASSKDTLKHASRLELQALSTVFDADVLVGPLFRVLDQPQSANNKIKSAALEYLLYLIQNHNHVFSTSLDHRQKRADLSVSVASLSSGTLRSTLSKLLHYYDREKPAVAGMAVSDVCGQLSACIAALYQVSSDSFLRCVLQLPPSDRNVVVASVERLVPHLEQDIRRAAAGERLLSHADVKIPSPFEKGLRESQQHTDDSGVRGNYPPSSVAATVAAKTPSQTTPRARTAAAATSDHKNRRDGGGATVTRSADVLFGDVSVVGLSTPPPMGAPVASTPNATVEPPARLPQQHRQNPPQQRSPSPNGTVGMLQRPLQKQQHYDATAFDAATAKNSDVLSRQSTATFDALQRTVGSRIQAAVTEHRLTPEELQLLRGARDSEGQSAALALATSRAADRPQQWKPWFHELMSTTLQLVGGSDHTVRIAALCALESMVKREPLTPMTSDHLTEVVGAVIDRMDDPFPEVRREASVVFHLITSGGFYSLDACLSSVVATIESRHACSSALLQGIESLGTMLWNSVQRDGLPMGRRCTEWVSEASLAAVARTLCRFFQHELSEVRKTVVGAIVHLWAVGDVIVIPLLRPLSLSQRKLVTIYFQRHATEHASCMAQSPAEQLQLQGKDLHKSIEEFVEE